MKTMYTFQKFMAQFSYYYYIVVLIILIGIPEKLRKKVSIFFTERPYRQNQQPRRANSALLIVILITQYNTEGHSFKTLRFFQVIRLCSHRFTFMLMTWKISSIFSTVTAHIYIILSSGVAKGGEAALASLTRGANNMTEAKLN